MPALGAIPYTARGVGRRKFDDAPFLVYLPTPAATALAMGVMLFDRPCPSQVTRPIERRISETVEQNRVT